MKFTVKNWNEFQHYKDRAPPWVKLHKGLLDDANFNRLSPLAGKSLVLIWILASESLTGEVTSNPDEIAFRLRISRSDSESVLSELSAVGFLIPAEQAEQTIDGKTVAQQISEKNGFGSRHISDKTKREVWMRDNGVCVNCKSSENIEYDHVHPVSRGGDSNLENVQLLCRPCNRKKRTKTAEQVATHAQPWLSLRTTETETETEAYKPEAEYQRQSTEVETDIEIKTLQPALPVAEKKSGVGLTEQMQKVCRETWQAYADAYFTRYGTEPVRNQKTNRNVIDFCKRVSMHEAADIARWYVGHSDAYYVRQMHAFGLLLKDAEKVRTEWATGQRMTQTKAKQADRAGNTASVVTEIMAERRAVA